MLDHSGQLQIELELDLSEQTAVKALIADADVEQQRDFFREAKAMIELDNPYIVRLLGICFGRSL